MTNETKLLTALLDCGYADVTYFCELLEDFDIEYSELGIDELIEDGIRPTVNALIFNAFRIVCERHNIDEERYRIFTNCLDSHLNIDGEEMYSEQDVKEKSSIEIEDEE